MTPESQGGIDPSPDEEKKRYESNLADLELICTNVVNMNEYIRGLPGDRRSVLGAAFFTLMCIHALQLRRILSLEPYRPIGPMKDQFQLRDVFCPTVLARSMLETYLNFFYLCCETVDDQTRSLRLAVWDWHDCDDRLRGTEPWSERDDEIEKFREARSGHRERIEAMPIWKNLPLEHKRRAFQAGLAVMKPLRLIAESAGISGVYFDSIHTFFSAYAHAAPLALSHSIAFGERTPQGLGMQWMSLSRQIDITIWLCCFAIRDILILFPDAKIKLHRRTQELIQKWSEIVGTWPATTGA